MGSAPLPILPRLHQAFLTSKDRLRLTEHPNAIPVPFAPTWPLQMLSIITFAPHAGIGRGTVVRLESSAYQPSAVEQESFDSNHDPMNQGWTGTLDNLAIFLSNQTI